MATGATATVNAGATLTLAQNLSYAGAFTQGAGSKLIIDSGDTLSLTGTSTLGGTVADAGTLALGGGSTAIESGAKLTQANWTVSGRSTTVTLSENLSYGGTFTQTYLSTLSLSTGDKLTLTGTSTLDGTVAGAGRWR